MCCSSAVDGRPGMGPLLGGREISDREQTLQRVSGGGRVRARTIPAEQAFGDYLELKGVGGLLRRAASAASLPMIAAATPGLEHLLVLGKIKELEKDRNADLIVVDAPPAGHAAPFLRSASGLSDVVKSGPVLDQASEVSEMLADPARCKALLVALPEETPITEVIELADDLGDDLGIALLPADRQRVLARSRRPREDTGDGGTVTQAEVVRHGQVGARVGGGVRSESTRPAARADRTARREHATSRSSRCPAWRRRGSAADDLATLADALVRADQEVDDES